MTSEVGRTELGQDTDISDEKNFSAEVEEKTELALDAREMEREGRQFVKYAFFKLDPEWRRLPLNDRTLSRHEFLSVLRDFENKITLSFYSLVGIRGDTDFMIYAMSERLEDFQEMTTRLLSTALGRYLHIPYSYLAMTRHSQYIRQHVHPDQEGAQLRKKLWNFKYLFVYPFVKKREWYRLPFEERQRMMKDHFRIGHKYPSVKINTAYSFGLDDQEFMLSFETDYPADFLDLVMELRSTEVSQYTQLETPIFTCIVMEPEKMLDSLG